MRSPTLLIAALLLTTLPAFASAHADHPPSCGTSRSVVNGAVHVDVWGGACVGATVWTPHAVCVFGESHVLNLHVMVLYGGGCQTGVLVERALIP